MADADTARLKKILTETYRNKAKDKRVKDAIRKRIADKKSQKKGEKFSKVRTHNLKTSLSSEAKGALKADKEKSDADDRVNDAKKKAEKPKPKPKKKKKDVFSVGLAAKNVLQMKDRGF
jgi:hypothetical protein